MSHEFLPWILMLIITVINLVATEMRLLRGSGRDTKRLRLAIHAELRDLLRLYEENLLRLKERGDFVLSGRGHVAIFKGNLGRVQFLPEEEIPPIVAAYALNERIENLVAATTNAIGQSAYKLIPSQSPVAEITARYEEGRQALLRLISRA